MPKRDDDCALVLDVVFGERVTFLDPAAGEGQLLPVPWKADID